MVRVYTIEIDIKHTDIIHDADLSDSGDSQRTKIQQKYNVTSTPTWRSQDSGVAVSRDSDVAVSRDSDVAVSRPPEKSEPVLRNDRAIGCESESGWY